MDYWPSARSRWLDIGQVLFLRVYGPRRSRGSWTRKKRTRPISNHLDRTNLVNKGFIIWLLGKFFWRDTAGSPGRARWLHLARSGNQSQRAIWVIFPARGGSHIIRSDYNQLALRARWLFYHFISNSGSWNNCYLSNRPQVSVVYKLINHAGCW